MNNEKLIMKALNYLLWVHHPRSDRSEEDRDKLIVDLQLAINPIENVPYEASLKEGDWRKPFVRHPEKEEDKESAKSSGGEE